MQQEPPQRPTDTPSRRTNDPAVTLGDPGEVPDTTPRPGEQEAQAAARIAREADGEQDAWGAPEDQPDHDGNEVYRQRDEADR